MAEIAAPQRLPAYDIASGQLLSRIDARGRVRRWILDSQERSMGDRQATSFACDDTLPFGAPRACAGVIYNLQSGNATGGQREAVAPGTFAAVQPLLGHAKLESAVRYLGIEVDDALEMAEQTGV